jgi:hypothetical protein
MPRLDVSKVRVELSAEELKALIKLAEDQLFRIKFIDPKMPGHKGNVEQVRSAESAVAALKQAVPKEHGTRPPSPSEFRIGVKEKSS